MEIENYPPLYTKGFKATNEYGLTQKLERELFLEKTKSQDKTERER